MFRLASHLGKTVSELDITWDEFIYWQAYFGIEPADEAATQRTAMILAQITNMSGRSMPKGKMVGPEDFLGKPKEQTAEDQIAFMRSISGDG